MPAGFERRTEAQALDRAWDLGWRAGHKEASRPIREWTSGRLEDTLACIQRELARREG